MTSPDVEILALLAQLRRCSPILPLEACEASARAWLEVASVGYFAWRAITDRLPLRVARTRLPFALEIKA